MADEKPKGSKLSSTSRWCAAILGALLLASSGLLIYLPPTHSTIKRDGNGRVLEATSAQVNASPVSVAAAVSGVCLFLFGLNGYRLVRFSAGGISAELDTVTETAKRQLTSSNGDAKPLEINKKSDPEPQATQPALGSVVASDGDEYAIYKLGDIPFTVVRDALANWPNEQSMPSTLSDFEYASRKKGKGNHSWQLKFRGQPLVAVAYGGYGKSEQTVNAA